MDPPPSRPAGAGRADLALGCGVSVRFGGLHRTSCARRRAPVCGVGRDAYDNAPAETTIGLFKTKLFKPRGPWRTAEHVEIAVPEWVDWYNHRRLHGYCGDMPPAELETAHYRQQTDLAEAGWSTNRDSGQAGAVQWVLTGRCC